MKLQGLRWRLIKSRISSRPIIRDSIIPVNYGSCQEFQGKREGNLKEIEKKFGELRKLGKFGKLLKFDEMESV